MTTAVELLDAWRERGVRVRRDGDELVLRGDLPDEEIALARVLKPELLDLLTTTPVVPDALAAGWRGACRELGAVAGWPLLPFADGRSVVPGEYSWLRWITQAPVPDLMLATKALREYLSSFPMPEPDVVPTIPNSPTLEDASPAHCCAACSQPCGTATRCSSCAARRVRTAGGGAS